MYGNTNFTAVVGGAPRPTDDVKTWVTFARSLAGIGLPVLLVKPGTKEPLDMRTAAEVKKDTEAAEGAKTGGVHVATTDKARLKSYVTRAMADPDKNRAKGTPAPVNGTLNWAVRLADSGYVVADADTPAEVAALKAYLAEAYGGEVPGATVLTPGTADGVHTGGGHWWFKLPEGMTVDPDKVPAVLKVDVDGHEAGFSLYVGNAYVLIPPSEREPGPYQLVSSDNPAPDALVGLLERALKQADDRAAARAEYNKRAASGELGTLAQQVEQWAEATPWHEVLEPHGWTDTGTVDSCGCPVYTAPGAHSSPKSATAHTGMCTTGRYDALNPPLHVWTDNPGAELEREIAARGGSKTLSKLTVWCAYEHGGDMAAALADAGIERDPSGHVFGPDAEPVELADANAGVSEADTNANVGLAQPGTSVMDTAAAGDAAEVHPEHVDPARQRRRAPRPALDLENNHYTPDGREVWSYWGKDKPTDPEAAKKLRATLPPWAPLSAYKDMPPTEYIVEGLLEHRGMCSVIGDSGVGKSAVVLDMAAHIAAGKPWHGRRTIQCPVVYVAGEGVAGAVTRLHAWQRAHRDYSIGNNIYIVEEALLLGSSGENWAYIAEQCVAVGAGLIVFDTLARMATGLDENSATDMGKGVTMFNRLQVATGAGVLLVHHTARGSSHARGSSAVRGAVDSEVLVTDVMVDGRPFATDGDDRPVDADGELLPGKPLTVKAVKQKNATDGDYTYLCLTERYDSVVVTDLDGNAATPKFAHGGGTSVTAARAESIEDTAERVADYVARYRSGEIMPTMADIARGVVPDRAHMDKAKAWRAHIGLAVDKALEKRLFYKVGAGFSTNPTLD